MNYAIAFQSRVGSTWLCRMMEKTGLLGNPREYFRHITDLRVFKGLISIDDSFDEYFEKVRDITTTPNGVFGIKVPLHEYENLVSRIPLNNIKFIHIQRTDMVMQAISAYLCHTANWGRDGVEYTCEDIPYNEEGILKIYKDIVLCKICWEETFVRNGIFPHRVFYENLIADTQMEMEHIVSYLQVELNGFNFAELNKLLDIKRTNASYEWKDRFIEEALPSIEDITFSN